MFARSLVANKSDDEIRIRLKRLESIGKGKGNDMYDALAKILEERQKK